MDLCTALCYTLWDKAGFERAIEMLLKRITHVSHPMYHEALKLYQISFPYHEQRGEASQEKILSDNDYHFCLIYDEKIFIGLVLYWETDRFIYIEHFCILPEMRNKQYGQETLSVLMEQSKTVLLEIDPPLDDISKRRKGFYERCGYTENYFSHIHPPYHKGSEGHDLVIMTCPKQISQEAFDAFSQYLKNRVMKNAFA